MTRSSLSTRWTWVSASVKRGEFVAVLGAQRLRQVHPGQDASTASCCPAAGHCAVWRGWTPWTRASCCWPSAGRWAWCSRTRTTRSWPTVVEEDVAFAPENLGVSSPRRCGRRVDDALAAAGMGEFARERAPHLPLRRPEAARSPLPACVAMRAGLPRAGRGHRHAGPAWAGGQVLADRPLG